MMAGQSRGAPRVPLSLSLGRVQRVLDCFVPRNYELTLTEIQVCSELPMTTTHRLVQSMTQAGFLTRRRTKYRIGWRISHWALAACDESVLPRIAERVLSQLTDLTGETASLIVREELERVCIASTLGQRPVAWLTYAGDRFPLQAGASSKVLLAFDENARHLVLKRGLIPFTERTVTSTAEFLAELDQTRASGYALSREEVSVGVASVCAPIFNSFGDIVAALNLGIPIQRGTVAYQMSVLDPVRRAAEALSEELGWSGDDADEDSGAARGNSPPVGMTRE